MSTSQHRELTREAEQALPNHKALSRANLLLIGCLSTGEDGWRVSDSSGSVHCEVRIKIKSLSHTGYGPIVFFCLGRFLTE